MDWPNGFHGPTEGSCAENARSWREEGDGRQCRVGDIGQHEATATMSALAMSGGVISKIWDQRRGGQAVLLVAEAQKSRLCRA